MCINRTTTRTISFLVLVVSFKGWGRILKANDSQRIGMPSLDLSPSRVLDGPARSLEVAGVGQRMDFGSPGLRLELVHS